MAASKTSMSRTLTVCDSIAHCMEQPRATASSKFSVVLAGFLKTASTAAFNAGILVEPPTNSIKAISFPVRSRNGCQKLSKLTNS